MNEHTYNAQSSIQTLEALRAHLQTALQIEHATIPVYFTAWLSIKTDGNTNSVASEIVRSVMLEEMLHLSLAANLLNAIGGKPSMTHKGFVPRYPHRLPHSGNKFEISIERFSKQALETFLKIERPEAEGSQPEPGEYKTIGQFYAAIREGFEILCERLGEENVFIGEPSRQLQPEHYYGGGTLVVVTNLESAKRAISEIVEQGEGADEGIFDRDREILGNDEGEEPAHYFRFLEVLKGRQFAPHDTQKSGPTGPTLLVDYNAVFPIQSNACAEKYHEGSEIRNALNKFGYDYHLLLTDLEASFNGSPSRLTQGFARMFAIRQQALWLLQTPSGDGQSNVGLDFRHRMDDHD